MTSAAVSVSSGAGDRRPAAIDAFACVTPPPLPYRTVLHYGSPNQDTPGSLIAMRIGRRDDRFRQGQNENIHTAACGLSLRPGLDPICATRCFPVDFVCTY